MLKWQGKALQVLRLIDDLARRHGELTVREYWRLCVSNGGR